LHTTGADQKVSIDSYKCLDVLVAASFNLFTNQPPTIFA